MKKSYTFNSSSMKKLLKKPMGIVILLLFCLSPLLAEPCGDVNSDGAIDIVDGLLIAQYYVGLNPGNFDEAAADVNGDGVINILDALLAAQFYVDLIPSLPGCEPTPTPEEPGPTPESVTYERQAEEAQYSSGSVDTNHDGYTGTGFVNTDNASGEWIEWSIEVADACNATCAFRYASGGGARPMNLTINSSGEKDLAFAGSSAWNDWQTETADVILAAGSNAIRLTATGSGGSPNMDKMDITIYGGEVVTPATPTPTPTPIPTPTPTRDPNWTPHWHESKGFGTDTEGGITGEVYKVTNLNSSGFGSLIDAVSSSNTLVVFEVGGVIDLGGSSLSVGSNITIAGQTAPYPGITTIRGNFRISGSNIVVSHITHHLGNAVSGYPDAMNVKGSNIVLDHVAVYWGKDETLAVAMSHDVTLYKCLVAEGLQFTGHSNGEHSRGLHLQEGDSRVSVISGLQVNTALRNPRLDGGEAFLANWILYNWGPGWDNRGPMLDSDVDLPDCPQCYNYGISARMNADITIVGCVGLQGLETLGEYLVNGHYGETAYAYMEDNIIKDREGNDLNLADSAIVLVDSPEIWPEGVEYLPAHEALYEVLRTVGPHPGQRNYHNERVIRNVANGTGEIIDSENEVGGYPDYPATYRALGEIPDSPEARQAWLDELENEIAVDTSIDLSRLYNLVGSRESDILAP